MIIVIADDFTGAAELGGIALNYNLKVDIQREHVRQTSADILIIDSDTRSLKQEHAKTIVTNISDKIKSFQIDWIFKKTDSVLRGHILTELLVLLDVLNKQRVILIPENPSLGRIISNGIYLINNKPLHKTEFANDPEYPARSSCPLELLGSSEKVRTFLLKITDKFPETKIIIGEADSEDVVEEWTQKIDKNTIAAGGSDFFKAILHLKGYSPKFSSSVNSCFQHKKTLIVCGSASEISRNFIEKSKHAGKAVCEIPEKLFQNEIKNDPLIIQWANEIIAALHVNDRVIAAINKPVVQNSKFSEALRINMALTIKNVLQQVEVYELVVEGGATAASIVELLRWIHFEPCQELARGVVRMRVLETAAPLLTLKPGSYSWQEIVL